MGSLLDDAASFDFIVCGGGTAGCVVAGRLAEDPSIRVLVLEAGRDNEDLENTHIAGAWASNLDGPEDWNIISEKGSGINNRQVKLSRGKFLGGSSGLNGTLCIKGSKQDYDDWGLAGWSGEEFFRYMEKAETFHDKPGFKAHIHLGIRTTGADFITKTHRRDNIVILTETYVEKVLFQVVEGELLATGVRAVSAEGVPFDLTAAKEVIISGGSYCSPNILQRSGIGAKDDLAALDIPSVVDLPGVGKNLMDHLIVFMFYEVSRPGLTNDHLAYHDDALAKSYKLWKESKDGFLASFPFGSFGFARLDDRLADSQLWNSAPRTAGRDPMGLTPKQPNIEFFHTECYGGPKQFDKFPVDHKHAFAMIAELFAPRSRGTVGLQSTNPLDGPKVDCGYLQDPLDVEVLAEACRFGNEIIVGGKGTKDVIKGSWPPDLTHHTYTTREDWIPYVKDNATTCYHAAGTCAMGKREDPNSVVDEKLRVKGVANLRVADVSIMPTLHGGHTQMPAYGIGEKAADLIKERWGLGSAA
ncbi:putative gmc oxidoreductase [Diaporthe ampelina]|uniref:Putative gmc oxidoreductase n=1 Tax=Diaporthe ampelina TaxID=1214573 RepID=A0A0G2F5Z5_9PEZI|nr:putative gmc oxidoreductase [Diaporthe ampelina]